MILPFDDGSGMRFGGFKMRRISFHRVCALSGFGALAAFQFEHKNVSLGSLDVLAGVRLRGAPYRRVRFQFSHDAFAAHRELRFRIEFRAGRFSLASDMIPADVEPLRREPDFGSGYRESPRLITYYAAFNTHRPPLSDKQLRHSLVRAVDFATLVRQTLGRLAVPAHGLIPPGLLGHDPTPTRGLIAAPSGTPEQSSSEIELTAVIAA